MKRTVYVLVMPLALSACTSLQPARQPQPPASPPVPAWILEQGPNLLDLLDKLISPSEKASTSPAASSPPAKTNLGSGLRPDQP